MSRPQKDKGAGEHKDRMPKNTGEHKDRMPKNTGEHKVRPYYYRKKGGNRPHENITSKCRQQGDWPSFRKIVA